MSPAGSVKYGMEPSKNFTREWFEVFSLVEMDKNLQLGEKESSQSLILLTETRTLILAAKVT